MSAHTPSSGPPANPPARPAVLAAVTALVVAGGLVAWAVLVAPEQSRLLIGGCAGAAALALVVAVTAAVHQRTAARHFRDRAALVAAEAADLADRLAPALVERLRAGSAPATALTEVEKPVNPHHERVLRTLAEEVGRGERARSAAMAACGNAAGRMQALATSMLADLREMEERHGEEVLGDLLRLDHSTAQAGRLADSIAVLTGSRSGRRWTKPIVMESILRGAVGRVSAYQRVRTHSASSSAVVGYAAEGVMHALAELVDNACNFSPPSEQVHVYVEEAQAGVVVTIEDGGLVMGDLALRRAERLVSGDSLDLTGLSGTRLGLAVVGRLARKHGLVVSFRPSSRGGTGVVVMIPRTLITEPRQSGGGRRRSADSRGYGGNGLPAFEPALSTIETLDLPVQHVPAQNPPAPRPAPIQPAAVEPVPAQPTHAPQEHTAQPADTSDDVPEQDSPAEDVVLPRRHRGSTLGATFPGPPRRPVDPAPPRADAGSRFGAFRNATRPESRPTHTGPQNSAPQNNAPGPDEREPDAHVEPGHDPAAGGFGEPGARPEVEPLRGEAPHWPS
ncbi:ATP-binding protein [Saccharothrix longispora]|uniref:ATP-binding protein n=1 Tax=Saccharothrix longispora TaxID=33920 RepID=UPI0028FD0FF3|nr:ATP-binding protein [Saccharothrix longispora]MDU0287949.1 ATP-binding protein [Saccharothrix longispora]